MVSDKKVGKLKYPFPGTVNESGWLVLNSLKKLPNPPRALTSMITTRVDETIITSACRESVHITERMPDIYVKMSANTVAKTAPVVKEIPPPVIPSSK